MCSFYIQIKNEKKWKNEIIKNPKISQGFIDSSVGD